jgi:hypothetical protein
MKKMMEGGRQYLIEILENVGLLKRKKSKLMYLIEKWCKVGVLIVQLSHLHLIFIIYYFLHCVRHHF